MSDEMLSQEEIEALLRGETLEDKNSGTEASSIDETNDIRVEDYLDSFAQDALGEVGNISFGSSATALSALLGQKVDITTPSISMINRNKLEEEFPHPYVAVQVEYTIGLTGMNLLVIKQSDAAIIADLMLGGDGLNPKPDLGEIQLSAVQEAMNQMMGSAATSMSTVFNKKVDISPPTIDLMNISQNEGRENIPEDDLLVKVSFRLRIGNLIDSNLMQLLPLKFSQNIVKSLLGETESIEEPVAATIAPEAPPIAAPPVQQQAPVMPPPAQPVYQQPEATMQQPVYQEPQQFAQPARPAQPVNVQQAQFASFDSNVISQSEARNLNMLLDIPLQVTVELGRTKRSVKEILELSSGSIIELDKLAGEPVDILVNSRLIAKGEVVVIDENFGVRITDVLSQAERLNNLR
ncbi:flagellar motor switch phosphatase FliY [Lysinibacillus fusiformis]|jgi:flagellar motor switch protein FliN/FliY|uniref:Flagellar motor switch protein FliN/FliY n=1 Tax=Lysinibacillus fusiformis TaxID=28031 RepID=A0A1H9D5G3_9BACI|nr:MULTISPECIES: flagellar motor switch phosphatase FliY [Lysinibacillus]EAZ83836.1 flagellar motor switch protein [Bacillus sp. B14905]AJK88977.1 flagellar motor switch protein FliN [Lysinibacillus fusiformis]KAB0441840.1 flagellar motor switch phosphatase FliY [Lysinibacillus fusiformis]KEK09637.1 flagellar motor switch protein FliN [Lysinibacillus sphaericus]KGA82807.1 flagellar motor switch protein FliN [Lysinibacillus fusiformis]